MRLGKFSIIPPSQDLNWNSFYGNQFNYIEIDQSPVINYMYQFAI